jgi:hypothetical protein
MGILHTAAIPRLISGTLLGTISSGSLGHIFERQIPVTQKITAAIPDLVKVSIRLTVNSKKRFYIDKKKASICITKPRL